MKNLTKSLMFITALGCMQQMSPMMGGNSSTYTPGGAVPAGSIVLTGAGDYKNAKSVTYDENLEIATLVDAKNNTYLFANVKKYSQATTPVNLQYPELNLKLFATMPNPKYIASSKNRGGNQHKDVSLHGTPMIKVPAKKHAKTK